MTTRHNFGLDNNKLNENNFGRVIFFAENLRIPFDVVFNFGSQNLVVFFTL